MKTITVVGNETFVVDGNLLEMLTSHLGLQKPAELAIKADCILVLIGVEVEVL